MSETKQKSPIKSGWRGNLNGALENTDVSGVNSGTIKRMRNEKPVDLFLVQCVLEVLENNEFQYLKRGRPRKETQV